MYRYSNDAPQRIVTKSLYRTAPPFSTILNGLSLKNIHDVIMLAEDRTHRFAALVLHLLWAVDGAALLQLHLRRGLLPHGYHAQEAVSGSHLPERPEDAAGALAALPGEASPDQQESAREEHDCTRSWGGGSDSSAIPASGGRRQHRALHVAANRDQQPGPAESHHECEQRRLWRWRAWMAQGCSGGGPQHTS